MKKLNWFKFYPTDFMDDEDVKVMTYEARGLYISMLCHCWTNDSLPADLNKMAKIFHISKNKLLKIWPQLSDKFFEKNSRLFNNRILREKNDLQKDFDKKSAIGRENALKRWQPHSNGIGLPNASAISLPMQDTEADTDTDADTDSKRVIQEIPTTIKKGEAQDIKIDIQESIEIIKVYDAKIKPTGFNSASQSVVMTALSQISADDIYKAIHIQADIYTTENTQARYKKGYRSFFDVSHINLLLSGRLKAESPVAASKDSIGKQKADAFKAKFKAEREANKDE